MESKLSGCSLRRGWLQAGLVVSGYALLYADVRPRVDIVCMVLIKEGWLPRARLAELQSTGFSEIVSYVVTTATKLLLLLFSVLPDASDRGLLI